MLAILKKPTQVKKKLKRTNQVTFSPIITRKYTARLAETKKDLDLARKLRYQIFHREFANKRIPFGKDKDKFDRNADHLLIFENESSQLVGYYRLIIGEEQSNFYCSSEFDLEQLSSLRSTKLELSRACISKDFRSGAVITILWRGIKQYCELRQVRYIFGAASVKTESASDAIHLMNYFYQQKYFDGKLLATPLENFRLDGIQYDHAFKPIKMNESIVNDCKALTPSLLMAYFRAGASVVSYPAHDADFRCLDFLTVLDMSELTERVAKKFN